VLTEYSAGGKVIGLLQKGTALYAFSATCPHAGAPLCAGFIDARGKIACPLHGYRFDPRTGHNTSSEGYKLRTFPIEIRPTGTFVGLPG
jgi:3-phenylpropionate/trans-cinnamate dioxygenase ferredoxin subunit